MGHTRDLRENARNRGKNTLRYAISEDKVFGFDFSATLELTSQNYYHLVVKYFFLMLLNFLQEAILILRRNTVLQLGNEPFV